VFALDSHRTIVNLPLAQGADVVKFDPGLGRAYAACSSGVIAVYQEDDALLWTLRLIAFMLRNKRRTASRFARIVVLEPIEQASKKR
jgi:hypothetical protein